MRVPDGVSTGTGVAPASDASCGSRPQPGQTISTSSPATARSAARSNSPAPWPIITRAGAIPCAAAIASRSGAGSGYALTARRSANVAALIASACGGPCQAAPDRSSGA